jgi:hypothetical protein
MVVRNQTPATDYVRYAFGRRTDMQLYFYAASQAGDRVSFNDSSEPVIHHGRLRVPRFPDFDAFLLSISGLGWAVAPVPMSTTTGPLLLRPKVLRWPTDLGPYDIRLSWDGEPPHERSVNDLPAGTPPDLAVVRQETDVQVTEPES